MERNLREPVTTGLNDLGREVPHQGFPREGDVGEQLREVLSQGVVETEEIGIPSFDLSGL